MVATMVGFFFQDLVSVDVDNLAVKRFDTLMNCYRDDSRQYVSSITQFSVLFPLKLYNFSQYLIWLTGTCELYLI